MNKRVIYGLILIWIIIVPSIRVYADAHTNKNTETVTLATTCENANDLFFEELTLETLCNDNDTVVYWLTVSASGGTGTGSTNVTGTHPYTDGTIVPILGTADPGCTFTKWVLDGGDDLNNPISLTMDQNHTIQAIFSSGWTITPTAGAHGTINPNVPTNVPAGSYQDFTFTPDPHYHINDVLVDSASVGVVTHYNFTAVAADHTIEVSFDQDHPSISSPAALTSYPKSSSIAVSWTLPTGQTQTAYRMQTGNAGFTVIYTDTGKIVDATLSGTTTSPDFQGLSFSLRVYYWDSTDTQSDASPSLALMTQGSSGGGGGSTPAPSSSPSPTPTSTPSPTPTPVFDPFPYNETTGEVTIPPWVPSQLAPIIQQVVPWWHRYGSLIIIVAILTAFVIYLAKPSRKKKDPFDVVLNPDKLFR